jgi:hypothetical protein
VRSAAVVFGHPAIEVGLLFLDAAVDLLAEGDAVEFVEHGAVEALKAAERSIDGLWSTIGRISDAFTPTECANDFSAAGYDPG